MKLKYEGKQKPREKLAVIGAFLASNQVEQETIM
jgi:hypothetical protein